MRLLCYNLGRAISKRSIWVEALVTWQKDLRQPEVNEFDGKFLGFRELGCFALWCCSSKGLVFQHDILELDVSMDYPSRVEVCDDFYDLSEEPLGLAFVDDLLLLDPVEEVSPFDELEHDGKLLVVFEYIEHAHHSLIVVICENPVQVDFVLLELQFL